MNEEQTLKPIPKWIQGFTLFAGVIMPAISVSVETMTHICAETFFDPIPTLWHVVLVIFVPLAQFHVWYTINRGSTERLALTGLVNALTIGISLFYSIVYIPLVPLAALTLIFVVGLLPLAPYLSLLAAIVMRNHLKRTVSRAPQKTFTMKASGLFLGLGICALLIALIELPSSLTRYGLRLAASPSPATRTEGIRFLRSFGSKEYLLRSCYERTGWATDIAGFLFSLDSPVTPSEARTIYYRVTGETFDTSEPPQRREGLLLPMDEFDFDDEQGGVEVGGKLKGLSLASSNLDARADANGGVAYMQWTMVFRNDSQLQREARAEVQLPPGAVVSRLTLWINGEEREAAFAGRGKVRQAYEQIVRQRRDPVLVTTAGRDRILVQCFPVLPNNSMKIRVGITVPLVLEDRSDARFVLPHFISNNFKIPDNVHHYLWLESRTAMSSLNYRLTSEQRSAGIYTMRGGIPNAALLDPQNSIKLTRSSDINEIWSKDPFQTGNFIIQQSIQEHVPMHLQRIVVVLDTSGTNSGFAWEIERAIRWLPPEFDVKLVVADADGLYESDPQSIVATGQNEIRSKFSSLRFGGGADNAPALFKAWDLAAEKPGNNAIVWIHGPQFLEIQSVEELRQRWARRPYGPTLYSVQTGTGSDAINRGLDGVKEVKAVPRTGRLEDDLMQLFARLTGRTKTLEWVRTSKKVDQHPETFQTSEHLARLWANDEVARIMNPQDGSLEDAAIQLAVRYQLVTPVSGAVVLETQQQYDAAGLTPVDSGTVPTIPEPEMIALLVVAGVLLTLLLYRKYRTNGGGGGCPA